jgi:hypothetical protein
MGTFTTVTHRCMTADNRTVNDIVRCHTVFHRTQKTHVFRHMHRLCTAHPQLARNHFSNLHTLPTGIHHSDPMHTGPAQTPARQGSQAFSPSGIKVDLFPAIRRLFARSPSLAPHGASHRARRDPVRPPGAAPGPATPAARRACDASATRPPNRRMMAPTRRTKIAPVPAANPHRSPALAALRPVPIRPKPGDPEAPEAPRTHANPP